MEFCIFAHCCPILKICLDAISLPLSSLHIIIIYYHAHLGLNVIMNDYIQSKIKKRILLQMLNITSFLTILALILTNIING